MVFRKHASLSFRLSAESGLGWSDRYHAAVANLTVESIKRSTQSDNLQAEISRESVDTKCRFCCDNCAILHKMWKLQHLQPKQIGRQAPLQHKAHSKAKHRVRNIQPSTPRSMPNQGKQYLAEQRRRLFAERMKALGSQPL